jgi:hypothetical protein
MIMVRCRHRVAPPSRSRVGRSRAHVATGLLLCLCLSACENGNFSANPATSTTRAVRPSPSSSVQRSIPVPDTVVPTSIPALFMPQGGWHLVVGIGQQAMLSISPNKILSELSFSESPPRYPTLEGQLPLSIVSGNTLLVAGSDGTPEFYISIEASGRHLYQRAPSATGGAGKVSVTYCAGAIRDKQCGA